MALAMILPPDSPVDSYQKFGHIVCNNYDKVKLVNQVYTFIPDVRFHRLTDSIAELLTINEFFVKYEKWKFYRYMGKIAMTVV